MTTAPRAFGYDSDRYARAKLNDPRHLRRIRLWVRPQPGERTLEVGAGIGHLVKALQESGVDALGIDVNAYAVHNGLTGGLSEMEAGHLDFPSESFDGLMSFHVLEHIPDLDVALEEMARVLAPGGRMLLVYPAEPIRGLYATPASLILYGTPWRAREIHVRTVTPARLRGRIASLGLPLAHRRSRWDILGCPQFETLFERVSS